MNAPTSRFVLGVVVGLLLGALAVVFVGRRAGSTTGAGVSKLLDNAMNVGRQAARDREQELREEYYRRVQRQKAEIFKEPASFDGEFQRRPDRR